MEEIRWELYPLVATSERSRAWLQLQNHLQLAPKQPTFQPMELGLRHAALC